MTEKKINWKDTLNSLKEQINLLNKTRHAIRGWVIHVRQTLPNGGTFDHFLNKDGKLSWAPGQAINEIKIFPFSQPEQEDQALRRTIEVVNGWIQGNVGHSFSVNSITAQEAWDIVRENLEKAHQAVSEIIINA